MLPKAEALGIFQSDIIVRTAIQAALADIRANPYLLDYIFSSLKKDALTVQYYGDKEIRNAKRWFLANEVKVAMVTQLNSGDKLPCISIEIGESTEVNGENTLGDVHYQNTESLGNDGPWPDLTDAFTPLSWNASTATFVLPPDIATQVDLNPGSTVVVTAAGNVYQIADVLDSHTAILANAGSNIDFRNCVIRSAQPAFVRHMESASFRESFTIGVHVHGDAVNLTYMHAIMVFALLRYREVLLEGRGFERSAISSTEQARNPFFGQEMVFSRFMTLSGYVRQSWPKQIVPTITSVQTQPAVGLEGEELMLAPQDPATGLEDMLWIGDGDASTLGPQVADYAVRGGNAPDEPVDIGPPETGAQGPAVSPSPNGQMASATQDDLLAGTQGNLTVATDKRVENFEDWEEDGQD